VALTAERDRLPVRERNLEPPRVKQAAYGSVRFGLYDRRIDGSVVDPHALERPRAAMCSCELCKA